jgi:hypothetical protein
MKHQEPVRLYNFSDAKLVFLAKEKAGFMLRDEAAFTSFGITKSMIADIQANATAFSDLFTDIEAASDMTKATSLKDIKAEKLRVAIRSIMSRVERVFVNGSSEFNRFGTAALSKQSDAELAMTAKRVVRAGTKYLTELATAGLSETMLADITKLTGEFESLFLDMKMFTGDRDDLQQDRVEAGNALYATIVSYTNTGKSIWETSDAAKYNDYIIYNTTSGEEEDGIPPSA